MTGDPITVVLVDDHAIMRAGLREIFDAQSDLVVVGEAGTSAEAIAVVSHRQPRVVLLDVEIPGGNVTDTVTAIRESAPNTEVVILSMHEGPLLVQRLLALGIRGYLVKSVSGEALLSAVRNACTNEGNVTLAVSRRSLVQLPGTVATLSPRELDILTLAARALSNAQIASRLYLAEATVKRHLSNSFAKLGAVSRVDAVNKAVAAALIPTSREYLNSPQGTPG
jgi:DNA-binding NarL/FixJ family response regulator